eukprot:1326566-Karenia_brevis.AAC.1
MLIVPWVQLMVPMILIKVLAAPSQQAAAAQCTCCRQATTSHNFWRPQPQREAIILILRWPYGHNQRLSPYSSNL